jgi:hypothetical protein
VVRAHRGGALDLLPDAKLKDKAKAVASLRRLAAIETIESVLPGDGWPVFSGGHEALRSLLERSSL